MKVRAKVTEINAICHPGPSSLTVMGAKGQQEAKKGDYIFMHGADPSTFEVVKKDDFDDKYEVVAEVPVDPALKALQDEVKQILQQSTQNQQ